MKNKCMILLCDYTQCVKKNYNSSFRCFEILEFMNRMNCYDVNICS